MDDVGGADADTNFMTLSDTSACGKMTALAKLLDLWYSEESANKVRVIDGVCCMLQATDLHGPQTRLIK